MAGEINNHLPLGPQQIGPRQPLGRPGPAGAPGGAAGAEGASFKDALVKSLEEVNELQKSADQAVERWATGGTQNVTEMLSAVGKADLAFKTLMQIRNKLVSAYEEIRQMRI